MKAPLRNATAGFSVVEAAVAAGIMVVALGSMFAFNSACLSLVRNAKESAASMLSNQQRVEELRGWNWKFITDSDYWVDPAHTPSFWVSNLMNAPRNPARRSTMLPRWFALPKMDFCNKPAMPPISEVTRTPSGVSVTAQNNPSTLYTSKMVQIDVTLSWKALGGRSRSRSSSAIIVLRWIDLQRKLDRNSELQLVT